MLWQMLCQLFAGSGPAPLVLGTTAHGGWRFENDGSLTASRSDAGKRLDSGGVSWPAVGLSVPRALRQAMP